MTDYYCAMIGKSHERKTHFNLSVVLFVTMSDEKRYQQPKGYRQLKNQWINCVVIVPSVSFLGFYLHRTHLAVTFLGQDCVQWSLALKKRPFMSYGFGVQLVCGPYSQDYKVHTHRPALGHGLACLSFGVGVPVNKQGAPLSRSTLLSSWSRMG